MISVMHDIHTNLSGNERKDEGCPPSIDKHVQVHSNKISEQNSTCLNVHFPMESSFFLWDNFLNSFFDSIVKFSVPRVEIPVVSYHSNPIFFIWTLFGHFDRVIAFPHRSAVTSGSVNEQVTTGMDIKEVSQVINFSSDNNP